MAQRDISIELQNSLKSNDPFDYFHLVKFEKPKPSGWDGAVAGYATDYTYITDAQYNIDWDDLSTDSEGNLLGPQKYIANKLLSTGGVQETTEARASTMSIKLAATSLGTIAYDADTVISNTSISGSIDYVRAGLREGDRVLIEQSKLVGSWVDISYFAEEVILYEGSYYVCILDVPAGSPAITEPEVGTGWTTYWDYSNHLKEVRLDGFGLATNISNSLVNITPIDTGLAIDASPYAYTFTNISEEINTLTFAKTSTLYTNYINREVFIYRAHTNPTTGVMIGDPFLLFKGIIVQGSIQESPDSSSIVTWSLSSHWGDFVRVQGRLTADESHRALSLTGRSDPDALLRPEYETDYGFMHADKSVNILGTYQSDELRYKTKKRGGIAGWLGLTKVKEYYETIDKDIDLRFNLNAKYLPVVYGVQKVSSIPVFADISEEAVTENNPQKLYTMYALCEGEIGGVYDIHVDETPSVCSDLKDFDAREPTGVASDSESNVEVFCYGRSDRGDVLSGNTYVDAAGPPLDFPWVDINSPQYRFLQMDGGDFTGRLYAAQWGPGNNNNIPGTMGAGIIHENSFSFTIPIEANFAIHTGKADQKADNIFVARAANSVGGTGFKIQKNYYDGDPSNYWSNSHRLLDTAYVSCEFTLEEGAASIPQYDFVIKGKYINCYNYDASFLPDPGANKALESAFFLDQLVDLYLYNGASYVITQAGLRIVDKWFIYNKEGNKEYRFITDLEPFDLSVTPSGGGVKIQATKLLYVAAGNIPDLTPGSPNTWPMVTYNHSEGSGWAISSPLSLASSALYSDNGGAGTLTIELSDDNLDAILSDIGTVDKAYVSLTSAPTYHFLVTGYTDNIGSNTLSLAAHSAAGTIIASQDYSNNVRVFISNLVNTSATPAVEGDTIKITRFTDGVPDSRLKTITYVNGSYAFTAEAFNKSLIPSLDSATWAETIPQDIYEVSPASDLRVSINPAMQLLDYISNPLYGKGLTLEKDLKLDTFKLSGILCDDASKITIVCDSSANALSTGTILSWVYSGTGRIAFKGTVTSKVLRSAPGNPELWEIILDDIIGKLGRKWNDWRVFEKGEIIWGFNQVAIAPNTSTLTQTEFLALTDIAASPGYFTMNGINVLVDRQGGLKNTNSIVRSWNARENVFSSPGYSLYDSDDVKYWKYLGWDSPEQRFVSRHQTNHVINTNTPIFDNINSMLKQCNGMLRYSNGRYELDIKIAAPDAADPYWVEGITSLSEDDVIGDIKLGDKGQKQSYNSISANIVDPQNKYGARSISFFNSDYLKEDKGVPKQGNYSMPGVTNYYNARTNIIQYLDESRYGLTLSMVIDPKGYMLMAGFIVRFSYTRFLWDKKLFRIETLTLQSNGLVFLVLQEHNDKAFLIDYSDRSAMDIDVPPVPPIPANLAAPIGLTASQDLDQKIVLNWTNSPTYDRSTQRIEIWAREATRDPGNDNKYFEPYQGSTDFAGAKLIGVGDGLTWAHLFDTNETIYVYYYWIRYVQYKNNRPDNYSAYEPLKTSPGVEGIGLGSESGDGFSIFWEPHSILLQADSLGQVTPPGGPYANTSTNFRVLQGVVPLIPVLNPAPALGEFTVAIDTINSYGIDTGPPIIDVDKIVFPEKTNLVAANALVIYDVKIGGVPAVQSFNQPIGINIEGADAWQVNGTNAQHIFIADFDGSVQNNDFSNIPSLSRAGVIFSYDDNPVPTLNSFSYGSVFSSSGISVVLIDDFSGGNTGTISIQGDSTILDAGGPISATIDIQLMDNSTGLVVGILNMLLTKVYSGVRGGTTFSFDITNPGISEIDVDAWVGVLTDVAAVNIGTAVVNLGSNDGWLRPNDIITVADPDRDLAGQRIYTGVGVDITTVGSIQASQFSSLVVEVIPGSAIVQGTLSADRLAANTVFVNNAYIGSNLVVGSPSAFSEIKTIQIVNGGSSYSVNDILTLVGGTFASSAATARVTSVSSGLITSVIQYSSGDYTSLPSNPTNTSSTGGGSGATVSFLSDNLWGQIYSYQKASFGDGSSGFFMDADGFFDVGDDGSYLRFDPVLGTVTLKGNLIVQSSNTHLVTWSADDILCTLDEYNQRVFKAPGGSGWVISNTAYGKGAIVTCEPATITHDFHFGLSDLPNSNVLNFTDIEYGWNLSAGVATAYTGNISTGVSNTYSANSLLRIYNDGDTIIWTIDNVAIHILVGQARDRVYAWKGVFSSTAVSPSSITAAIGMLQGGTDGIDGIDGADGADGADGVDGVDGADGIDGPPGATGPTGEWGAAMYEITSASNDISSSQITTAKVNGVIGRAYYIAGDVCIVVAADGLNSAAYRRNSTNTAWNVAAAFIDGDLVVSGGIDARELRISNSTGGTSGIYMDGANNRIDVYEGANLRVRLGNLA